jgi:hypothetical protein
MRVSFGLAAPRGGLQDLFAVARVGEVHVHAGPTISSMRSRTAASSPT